jgi:hypothetical protein
MKIFVSVKPNKSKEGVEKISDTEFIVYTKKLAVEGRANEDVVKQLAKYFKISKSAVSVVRGKTTKKKIVEIKSQNSKGKSTS